MRLASVRTSDGQFELAYVTTDRDGVLHASLCTSWGVTTRYVDVGQLLQDDSAAWEAVRSNQPSPRDVTDRHDVQAWRLDDLEVGPPVLSPKTSLLVGTNYRTHAAEQGAATAAPPTNPAIFAKLPGGFVGHNQRIAYPNGTQALDYEAELVAIIGRHALDLDAQDAWTAVAGYTVMNDLTRRDIQLNGSKDAILFGKNFPGSAPLGPVFVSVDEFDGREPHRVRTWVNGDLRQDGTTADMIFGVGEIVAWASSLGLQPGDVIATGTPEGVALFAGDDSFYLKSGDEVTVQVEDVCSLTTYVD